MSTLLALASLWTLPGIAQASAEPDACDAPASHAVLQGLAPGLAELDAAAHWLGRDRLFWSGAAPAAGRILLAHSAQGRLQASPGEPLRGADGTLELRLLGPAAAGPSEPGLAYLGEGLRLAAPPLDDARLAALLRQQLLLVQEDEGGRVLRATSLQLGGVLDERYAAAGRAPALGALPTRGGTGFRLWAPTAQAVTLCRYASSDERRGAIERRALQRDDATGIWSLELPGDLSGSYYAYLLDVHVRGVGRVRNRVTDPYSVSLGADSRRSYLADLASARLKPAGWDAGQAPRTVRRNTDMVVYELHVRDFSIGDTSVPAAHRGKYLAFTDSGSRGMRHLRALARAGMTDVHLLPVFDIASVPERGCVTPVVPAAAPDSEAQQAAVMAVAAQDCFNWGYDPLHFNAPEGSYSSDARDGAKRILEFRRMVQALHRSGLRVGMDVVYNHTAAAGQHAHSVLDRIVPGYYQRYDARGRIERSTCCDNTASERLMMGRLIEDSVLQWAREYKISSFRFDLMAHQPRALMERLAARLREQQGHEVQLIGEGWNFGEVANGARFEQASQLSLNGSGIGTFSDRARDALRGGGAADSGAEMVARQGWLNGQHFDPNALGGAATRQDLMRSADLVRVGLAGSLRSYEMQTFDGAQRRLEQIDYAGQPAGYVSAPGEVVNYVDNHDNQTLFDINVLKLPVGTSREDRARVQVLGMAVNAFSQGVAYFHAGIETLRSKSLDRNSYDSGDWFNRLDWTLHDNGFGAGLPPKGDNGSAYEILRPLLADASIKPRPAETRWTRDAFLDLLRLRASSSLFRLDSAEAVRQRLILHNTGPDQNPLLLVGELDGRGLPGAGWQRLIYFVNTGKSEQAQTIDTARGQAYHLHPVHLATGAADKRPGREARFDIASGRFVIPARCALVFVLD